jgi:hypothetical protein
MADLILPKARSENKVLPLPNGLIGWSPKYLYHIPTKVILPPPSFLLCKAINDAAPVRAFL